MGRPLQSYEPGRPRRPRSRVSSRIHLIARLRGCVAGPSRPGVCLARPSPVRPSHPHGIGLRNVGSRRARRCRPCQTHACRLRSAPGAGRRASAAPRAALAGANWLLHPARGWGFGRLRVVHPRKRPGGSYSMWHQQRAVHLGGRVQNASEGLARVQRGDATGAVGSSRDRAFPSAAFGVGGGVAARHAVLPEPPETGKGEVIGQSGAWTKLSRAVRGRLPGADQMELTWFRCARSHSTRVCDSRYPPWRLAASVL